MKKRTGILMLSVTAVAGGAALVVTANRLGWLPGAPPHGAQIVAQLCRHTLPAGECPFCDPGLVTQRGQCGEHGVPEALCTKCHPALIAACKIENDWCAEHNVPDSQCAVCHPERGGTVQSTPVGSATDTSSITLVSNPQVPRSQRAPSVSCTTEQKLVQFKSAEVAARAGLTLAPVQRREITQVLQCNAELVFNGDRYAHVSPRAPGVVQRVEKHLGDHVQAGDLLAVIDSVELGGAKAELLQAQAVANLWQKNYQQQRELAESGVKSQRELLDAQTKMTEADIALSRAAQRLRNLGLTNEQIDQIKQANDTTSLLAVTAPFDGVVVDRHAVLGEVIDVEHALFTIADTSIMWAMLDVYEADTRAVAVGQSVTLALQGLADQPVSGRITWVSAQIDPQARTLKARAEIANAAGALRASMFGRASISVHDREKLLAVPREAVQWEGCCNVVFVKRSETEFQPRKVKLGYQTGDWAVVEDGLQPNELVVTQGSFLLKTEVMKGSIGAGCCAEDGKK